MKIWGSNPHPYRGVGLFGEGDYYWAEYPSGIFLIKLIITLLGFTATPTRCECTAVPPMKHGHPKNGAIPVLSAFWVLAGTLGVALLAYPRCIENLFKIKKKNQFSFIFSFDYVAKIDISKVVEI